MPLLHDGHSGDAALVHALADAGAARSLGHPDWRLSARAKSGDCEFRVRYVRYRTDGKRARVHGGSISRTIRAKTTNHPLFQSCHY